MYPNFQTKGLLPNRVLENFIQKSTDGAISFILYGILLDKKCGVSEKKLY